MGGACGTYEGYNGESRKEVAPLEDLGVDGRTIFSGRLMYEVVWSELDESIS
jgi:hypothetical protein